MNKDFERVHAGFTAGFEGGYVNDPDDPGGETNLGVTKSVWLSWCKAKGLPVKSMRTLTMADVLPLYQERYWAPFAGKLPWPLSGAIYDMSVNHGAGDTNPDDEGGNEEGATYMLWRAKQLKPKGTPVELALAACDAREAYYHAIVARRPTSQKYLKGWLRRNNALRAWLQVNAAPSAAATPPVFLTDAGGKRSVWDGKPATYAGAPLSTEWLASIRLLCPPGTALGVVVAADGAVILSRITQP